MSSGMYTGQLFCFKKLLKAYHVLEASLFNISWSDISLHVILMTLITCCAVMYSYFFHDMLLLWIVYLLI